MIFFKEKNTKTLKIYKGNLIIIGLILIVNLVNFRPYFCKIKSKNTNHYNCKQCTKIREFINFIYKSFLLLLIKQALNFNFISFRACYGTDLIYTITHCSVLFPTVSWPTTSTLVANFAYLYTLPLCTFFSFLYHNIVIQFTLLQYCNSLWYL